MTWATYLKCCILQIFAIYIYCMYWLLTVSCHCCRRMPSLCYFLAFFFANKYSFGIFFRLKPLFIIFLRKPCQIVSSFLSSLADTSSQECAPYSSLLRTQASKILTLVYIFILLSVRTCFSLKQPPPPNPLKLAPFRTH